MKPYVAIAVILIVQPFAGWSQVAHAKPSLGHLGICDMLIETSTSRYIQSREDLWNESGLASAYSVYSGFLESLTPTEREVLGMYVEGKTSNSTIREILAPKLEAASTHRRLPKKLLGKKRMYIEVIPVGDTFVVALTKRKGDRYWERMIQFRIPKKDLLHPERYFYKQVTVFTNRMLKVEHRPDDWGDREFNPPRNPEDYARHHDYIPEECFSDAVTDPRAALSEGDVNPALDPSVPGTGSEDGSDGARPEESQTAS